MIPKNGADNFTGLYDFLSNSFISSLTYKGTTYKSVTHAYNALKMKEKKYHDMVKDAALPHEAIKLARYLEKRDDWDENCKNVMLDLIRAKFSSPFLKHKLVETGNVELGNNKIFTGELLMKVRTELKSSSTENGDIQWTKRQ